MNTQISSSEPLSSVSQLAKTPFPTPISAPTPELRAGRQTEQKPHTLARPGRFFAISSLKPPVSRNFSMQIKRQYDFIRTIPQLFEQMENIKVVFHNTDYVDAIFDAYFTAYAHLFLDWVKTFAIIRKADRSSLLDNVIQSTDDDFLSALQLFRYQSDKPKEKFYKNSEKVWRTIERHFSEKSFTIIDLQDLTLLHYGTIRPLIKQWAEEGKIKAGEQIENRRLYQLKKATDK